MILIVTRKLACINDLLRIIIRGADEIVLVDDGVYNAVEGEELTRIVCREKIVVDAGDLEVRGIGFKELAENVRLGVNAYKLIAKRVLEGEVVVAV